MPCALPARRARPRPPRPGPRRTPTSRPACRWRVSGSAAGAALLTPREREIAKLAARGRTSKDVAGDLVLSVRTVDNHLANVYAKLGIPGRAELGGALALAEPEAPAVPRPRTGRQS